MTRRIRSTLAVTKSNGEKRLRTYHSMEGQNKLAPQRLQDHDFINLNQNLMMTARSRIGNVQYIHSKTVNDKHKVYFKYVKYCDS